MKMWMSPNSTCSDPWETVNLSKREDLSQVHHHHFPHHQPRLLTIVFLIVATFMFWSWSVSSWICPCPIVLVCLILVIFILTIFNCSYPSGHDHIHYPCPPWSWSLFSWICPCSPGHGLTIFDCSYPSGHDPWQYMHLLPESGHIIIVHLILVTVFVIPGQVREELSARLRIGWRGEARVERQGWRGEARVWAPCVFLCRGQALLTGRILEEYRFFSLFL